MEIRNDDSQVWVYAISAGNSARNARNIAGFDGLPIVWRDMGLLHVATSACLDPVSESEVERYQQIMLELLAEQECLPVRFGTRFRIGALRHALQIHEKELLCQWEWISGYREIAVRWVKEHADADSIAALHSAATADSSAKGGAAYLRTKHRNANYIRDLQLHSEIAGKELKAHFPTAIRAYKCNARKLEWDQSASPLPCTSSNAFAVKQQQQQWLIELTLLVSKDHCDMILDQVAKKRILDTLPLYANGPWPAFSFIDGRSAA